MSGITKCGIGMVLLGAVCISLFAGGPDRVVTCAPTPVMRAATDNNLGIAVNLTFDQWRSDSQYKDYRAANFYNGSDANGKFIGASCDPPAAYPGFQPVLAADGSPVVVNGNGEMGTNESVYPLYKPQP